MSSLVTSMMGAQAEGEDVEHHEKDAVYSSTIMYNLVNTLMSTETEKNNLTAFKSYLDDPTSEINDYISAIQYTYDLNLNIYAKDEDGNIVKSDITELLQNIMGAMYGGNYSTYFDSFGDMYSRMDAWEEMLSGEDGKLVNDLLTEQYDVIYGRWPESYDEVVLIVDQNNEVSDLVLYALGLESSTEMLDSMQLLMNGETVDASIRSWSYEDICNMTFKVILNSEYYQLDPTTGTYTDVSKTDAGLDFLYNSDSIGTTLKITGIIRPNEDAVSTMMSGAIGYTSALKDYVIEKTEESDIVKAQMENPDTDVISGLPFLTDDYSISDEEKMENIKSYISTLSSSEKANIYTNVMSRPTDEYTDSVVAQQMSQLTREYIEQMMLESYSQQMGVDTETIRSYISQMDDETLFAYVEDTLREQIAEQYAQGVQQELGKMTTDQLAAALDYGEFTDDQWIYMYDEFMPAAVSESTYDDNMDLLGYVDMSSPTGINIYASTFEAKDNIADAISAYNDSVGEDDEITYTDYVALLMSSITTIINAISYVLIAFVAISLVVSSIMIGIITYISVLERTKEIGILRAIGASKRDISRVFNAETLTIGLVSGALGIGITLLLTIPINMVIHKLTNIMTLNATLPPVAGAVLVAISMVLTFIAGLIPSGIAARKDPVEALRTE
jgi:putative ABC transport system permease protein